MHFCTICEIKFLVGGRWKSNVVLEKSLKNGCNFLYEPCQVTLRKVFRRASCEALSGSRFRSPIVKGIQHSLSWIFDFKGQDCGFQKQKLPRFRNPDNLIRGELYFRLPFLKPSSSSLRERLHNHLKEHMRPSVNVFSHHDLIKSKTSLLLQISIHPFSQTIKGLITEFSQIRHLHISHSTPCFPPKKFSISNTHESSQTRVMQSFLRQTKCIMGDGRCACGEEQE